MDTGGVARAIGMLFLALLGSGGRAAELREPAVLASAGGELDLLMIARPAPVPAFAPYAVDGWVYEICRRPSQPVEHCPGGDADYYGGTRLALQKGDTLKIHFLNRLPPATHADHALDPGEAFLALNPTNLHTHGLLVSPHGPSSADPTYGDNVFVLTFNPANGEPVVSPHVHAAVSMGATDYSIKIPLDHPSGLFWFHPHAHGIALNQVSAGLSGLITVGSVFDYVCLDRSCRPGARSPTVRHLLLKDTQVLADGALHDQQEPEFCLPPALSPPAATPNQGSCPGQNQGGEGSGDYAGGRWFFSINGQVYPTLTVGGAEGEIWRITNSSGSASYDLQLQDPARQRPMLVQLLSVDGVSVAPSRSATSGELAAVSGGKFRPVPCPDDALRDAGAAAVCVTDLRLMPSARVEVWVSYRDRQGRVAAPPPGAGAVLRTVGADTGPGGDAWPAIDLAKVVFKARGSRHAPGSTLLVHGDARTLMTPAALASNLYADNAAVGAEEGCAPLPPGHHRRIFFNAPSDEPDAFGLGYEEVDAAGVPVPGSFQDVHPFDPMTPTVCVPLGPGNTPVKEVWELVNLASEQHNFHIHQTKYRVISAAEIDGTAVPTHLDGDGVLMDNVPLQYADGACNSVQDWRDGRCRPHPVWVEIPFAIAGNFVYHCHILEHEDGGMMARIRVRAHPGGDR